MPATATAKLPTGIRRRHARSCAYREEQCSCAPSYEARVYSARDRREILRSFRTLSAARAWRHNTASAVGKGAMRAPTAITIRQAGDELLVGLVAGTVRKRGGGGYKPSVVHGYRAALRDRIYPEFGHRKLAGVERADVQRFAERLRAEGLSASTVRNVLMPLRLIYRRAVRDAVVVVNPTVGLEA
jgi:integrase